MFVPVPHQVHPENDVVEFEDGFVKPMVYQGVKLMSFGYVNSDSAIMRGPMIANMLTQLLTTTNWGVLDYLIIDMPPGMRADGPKTDFTPHFFPFSHSQRHFHHHPNEAQSPNMGLICLTSSA